MDAAPKRARGRITQAAGWALLVIGVVVSWAWAEDLGIAGAFVSAARAGSATFVLLGCGLALLSWSSVHRGRARLISVGAVLACAVLAIAAGTFPLVLTATTTGTVSASVTPTDTMSGYRLATPATVTSDRYRQTNVALTVHASDRDSPVLQATIAFHDGTTKLTCTNTRVVWIHDVASVPLLCNDFVPLSSLKAISDIAVVEK